LATLSDGLTAYRVCAKAEGRSPRTIEWVTNSMRYFMGFLGGDAEMEAIGPSQFRAFINALRDSTKYRQHPYNRPQREKLAESSINCYARAIRAFFSYLVREGFLSSNPLAGVRMPKVPEKVVVTFSEMEMERVLSLPDKNNDKGFRDYSVMLTLYDTAIRLSELAGLTEGDIDFDSGYLRVMGKGGKQRYVPFGVRVAKALMKYKVKHRPRPLATDRFWLTMEGRPLSGDRIESIFREYAAVLGIRCHPHKFRHTSSVHYLRNGGDPFSLQKKLGHSSLQMTRHYSNLADSDVRAAHLRSSPADRLGV